MDTHRPGKLNVWTPLLFSIILIAGMILGFNLRDTLRNKRNIQTIIERNDRLEQIIDLVNEKYVDTLNSNALYKDAVDGILRHLDPHSVYIPSDQLEEVNQDLEGSFFGIGVEFSIIRDTIQVTSVIEEGPAERAGVDIGDQLIKVGDSVVAGIGITSSQIIKMLKGKQYSNVYVTLKQSQSGRLKHIPIKRDAIPIYSVDASIMLDSVTGFIKINRFSATTYEEFKKAIVSLQEQGMKRLILDLRQNPGGYLEAATKMADEFLSGEKMVVYTEGKSYPKEEYKTSVEGVFEQGQLAILVDESSASASEILAGAIQDWDRGIIVGRRTFGKGLVQTQYEMDDGSALRLTIARYYIPSGRSIQRSFARGREEYANEFNRRLEQGELTGNDSLILSDTMKYYTDKKRVVYGGGGINPDVYVPYDTSRIEQGLLNIIFSTETQNTIWDYFIRNRQALQQYKNVKDFSKDFKADVLIERYYSILSPSQAKAAKKVLKDSAHLNYFRQQVKAQLARVLFRNNGYFTITTQGDHAVRRALQVFNSKDYSEIIRR